MVLARRPRRRALQAIKTAFRNAPILAHPSSNDRDIFVLDTDASLDGMGGVLSQIQDGRERAICFASRIFTKAERNYDVTRRELLAVVVFTNRFRHFLYGRPFILRQTTPRCVGSSTRSRFTSQSTRWITKLADFDMVVKHRPWRTTRERRRPFAHAAIAQRRRSRRLTVRSPATRLATADGFRTASRRQLCEHDAAHRKSADHVHTVGAHQV